MWHFDIFENLQRITLIEIFQNTFTINNVNIRNYINIYSLPLGVGVDVGVMVTGVVTVCVVGVVDGVVLDSEYKRTEILRSFTNVQ